MLSGVQWCWMRLRGAEVVLGDAGPGDDGWHWVVLSRTDMMMGAAGLC